MKCFKVRFLKMRIAVESVKNRVYMVLVWVTWWVTYSAILRGMTFSES